MNDPRLTAAAFDITWRNGAYYVSIPNLDHQTVVPASLAEEIAHENRELCAAIQACLDTANGRETEWGERAMAAFDHLNRALAEEFSSLPANGEGGKVIP